MNPARLLLLTLLPVALVLPALAQGSSDGTYSATASCAWDRAHLDVQIVPPTHPSLYTKPDNSGNVTVLPYGTATAWDDAHANVTVQAVEAWESAMHAYAATHAEAAHLAGFTLTATIVSPSTPLESLPEPDVRIAFVPTMAIYAAGITVTSCAPSNSVEYCPQGEENLCVIGGTNVVLTQWVVYSMTLNDTYNIALHEMGHVLGLAHVTEPTEDILQPVYRYPIGDERNPRMCASTLNLAQLSTSYAWLDGETPYRYRPGGVTIAATDYALMC